MCVAMMSVSETFRQHGGLISHERIHTNEKPFSCETCKKRFRHNGTLKQHELIHTGEKPYSCLLEEKKFKQSGSLKKHEKIQHSPDDISDYYYTSNSDD